MFVSKKKYERALAERDLWQQRAETALAALERTAQVPPQTRHSPRWATLLTAAWLVLAGLFIGVVVPKAEGPTLAPDRAACISQARYEHPVDGNQYQELVNALWDCEVFQ